MATIGKDPDGRKRILFEAPDGRRKTIRLGKCDQKTAQAICRHVEHLLASKMSGQPIPRETASWLAGIGEQLKERLAAVGLIEHGERTKIPTLGAFVGEYIQNRSAELKESTVIKLQQAERWLTRLLDPKTPINKITPSDADRVRRELLNGRARSTANKWTRCIKEFFNAAVNRGLIEKNPFGHIKGLSVVGDRERRVLIPEADIRRVLGAIPCPQFRLIVALARWAGIRIPSEALNLRWADVNWELNRMVIHASKTEHHQNGGVRLVPLFAEIRPYLEACWDIAETGQEFVITRYRSATANLRTQFNRWCLSAGVKPWPKPFQNMRATRATELVDLFPSHVCAEWLGHSEKIADAFYRSVTDEHFARAVEGGKSGTESGTHAAQNQAQQRDEDNCKKMKSTTQAIDIEHFMQSLSTSYNQMLVQKMARVGLEHPLKLCGNTALSPRSGTESGTLLQTDPLLMELIAFWSDLPQATKEDIVAMIRSATV